MSNGQSQCPDCGTTWDGISAFCPVCSYDFTETHFDTHRQPTSPPPSLSAPPSPPSHDTFVPPLSEPEPPPTPFQQPLEPPVSDHRMFPAASQHEAPQTHSTSFFGGTTITGTVISVNRSTARPQRSMVAAAGCLLAIGVFVVLGMMSAGPEIAQAIVPLLFMVFMFVMFFRLVGWFLRFGGKNEDKRPGFFTSVFSHFMGAYWSNWFAERREPIPVTDVRIQEQQHDGQVHAIRIEGDVYGDIQIGDVIEVHGIYQRGTLLFRRGYNQSTHSTISARRR